MTQHTHGRNGNNAPPADYDATAAFGAPTYVREPAEKQESDVAERVEGAGTESGQVAATEPAEPEGEASDQGFSSTVGLCPPAKAKKAFGDTEFAWTNWIPKGHTTMIAGEQGIGKSYLVAELIACFTGHRETWPNSEPIEIETGPVLVVETEQMKGAYVERLEGMGVSNETWVFGPGTDPFAIPDLPKQHDEIETAAKDIGAAAIVVDSLSGGHDKRENDAYMRKVLQPLSETAARLKMPIVIAHHPRKRRENEPSQMTLDRVRGSTTITQFCRSVIGLYYPNDEDEGLVRVDSIKLNFGPKPESFGFGFLGDKKGLYFTTAPEEREHGASAEAMRFLRKELSDGRVPSKQIQEDREQAGIAEATLNRAKRKIGAESDKQGGRWYWYLPAEQYEYERLK